jgi:hypothetical protein
MLRAALPARPLQNGVVPLDAAPRSTAPLAPITVTLRARSVVDLILPASLGAGFFCRGWTTPI